MGEARLTQIIYDEQQRPSCFPFSRIHFNKGLTIYFENEIISKLVPESKAKKTGVVSWKLKSKLRWNVPGPVKARELTQEVLESDYEVLSFTRNSHQHKMLEALEVWHSGSLKVLDRMLEIIGHKRPFEVKTPIYQNAFMAQTEIYKDYVTHYLNPAMEAIENDKELRSMALADSGYHVLNKVNPEHLKEKIGMSYYPLVPFILERLFSIYVDNEGLKVSHL